MKRNFQLGQSNEILLSERIYDLHNDYFPTAIVLDIQICSVHIKFARISHDDFCTHCALIFHKVDTFEIVGKIWGDAVSGINEMGFKAADDYDYDWLSAELRSAPDDHFVIRFDDGAILRVHGVSSEFVENRAMAPMACVRD